MTSQDTKHGVKHQMSHVQTHDGLNLVNLHPSLTRSRSDRSLTKDALLQRGHSRSMDLILNGNVPGRRSSLTEGCGRKTPEPDANNNTERATPFKRKFSCPEIADILGQYIPKEELNEINSSPPNQMRRCRSLHELPGSLRVPIIKRTESDRIKARLEASIAGTEELNKLRENQEKLLQETVNMRKPTGQQTYQQYRRPSTPSRTSQSSLSRIFEEETVDGDSDQDVFYENRFRDRTNIGVSQPRRTQSYRDSYSSGGSRSPNRTSPRGSCKENESYRNSYSFAGSRSPNRTSPRGSFKENEHPQPDANDSWTMWTQRADSLPDAPIKRSVRSNSLFVSPCSRPKSLLPSKEHETEPQDSNIDFKLRRTSLQCDALLTGWNRSKKSASIFEDMDIQSSKSSYPNPIRAVMMQYEVSKRNSAVIPPRAPIAKQDNNKDVIKVNDSPYSSGSEKHLETKSTISSRMRQLTVKEDIRDTLIDSDNIKFSVHLDSKGSTKDMNTNNNQNCDQKVSEPVKELSVPKRLPGSSTVSTCVKSGDPKPGSLDEKCVIDRVKNKGESNNPLKFERRSHSNNTSESPKVRVPNDKPIFIVKDDDAQRLRECIGVASQNASFRNRSKEQAKSTAVVECANDNPKPDRFSGQPLTNKSQLMGEYERQQPIVSTPVKEFAAYSKTLTITDSPIVTTTCNSNVSTPLTVDTQAQSSYILNDSILLSASPNFKNKYNSIASDDSLLTSSPSNYGSFCSSNLSSYSVRSDKRLLRMSIDEGYIASPPSSPEHADEDHMFVSNTNLFFQEIPKSQQTVSENNEYNSSDTNSLNTTVDVEQPSKTLHDSCDTDDAKTLPVSETVIKRNDKNERVSGSFKQTSV